MLTDLGVMYRKVGELESAVFSFEQAMRVDPAHLQSRFNLGVVYLVDLKHPEKAIELWRTVIDLAPKSEQAERARKSIEEAERMRN